MPKDFQYDVIHLINSVKTRPCLWDKSLESYKDRIERRLAWQEVFNFLEPCYKKKTSKEKKVTEEQIMTKWTNIRDAFIKTLKKNRAHGKRKRKYIYHNELKFLVNCEQGHKQSDEADNSSTECTDNSVLFNVTPPIKCEEDKDVLTNVRNEPRNSNNRDSWDNTDFNFLEVEESSNPRVMNEDEAFFASLLPSVVKYTEDERLEFRIEVLAIMRRIKDNRNWNNRI